MLSRIAGLGLLMLVGAGCEAPTKPIAFDTRLYQAVFLTNGQVYFGKLANTTDSFVTLTDVYYLQTNAADQKQALQGDGNIALVKLGGELHGPTDAIQIHRDAILMVEDLREDSKLVQTMQKDKK